MTFTPEPLLTPQEVGQLFRVDPKTVTRWAKAGKLTAIRTLGGHRRYRETEVRALLNVGLPDGRYPGGARPPLAVPADDASVHRALGLAGTVEL